MKRYFLTLLLVLLPIQFSWAIAGTYCAHEEAAATHFGHHEHKHDETTEDGTRDDDKYETKKIQIDTDCDYCHHVPSNAIAPAAPALAQPGLSTHIRAESLRYSSHIPDLIPRPDWSFRT